MLEVVMLGTGTPIADPKRGGSGTALVGSDSWILVDCGRGVTQRVIEAELDLTAIEAVLLTHHHSDHVSDLATLAIARWSAGATEPLLVVAPAGPCLRFATHCLDCFEDQAFYSQADPAAGPRPTIKTHEFKPGIGPAEILTIGSWTVSSALVDHHPIEAAVGYRVQDATHKVAVSGDTAACAGMAKLADGVDLLIHEALDAEQVREGLLTWNASARSVGALAKQAGVAHLVLTHLLPPPDSTGAERAFIDQATAGGYNGPITVAADLLKIRLS